MRGSKHIISGLILALLPALVAVAAPVESRVDVERLCYYSMTRSSPFAGLNANARRDAGTQHGAAQIVTANAGAQAPSRAELLEQANVRPHDSIATALEARDYVVDRGRVLMRDYELNVDADAFRFLPYDADVGLLGLQFAAQMPLFDGDASAVVTDPQPLYFEVSAEQAEELEALRSARALSITTRVQLSAREAPHLPFCTRDEEGRPVIELLVLDGTLFANASEVVLGYAVTDRFERAECEQNSNAPHNGENVPKVSVVALSTLGESHLSDTEGAMLRLHTETELHGCYLDALRHNAALRGAVVLEFSFKEDGTLSDTGIIIDAANNNALTHCTLSALDVSTLPRAEEAAPLNVRMSLTFSRR